MGTPEPQLEMIMHTLGGVPSLQVPEGYRVRHFSPNASSSDERNWSRVYAESFEREYDPTSFAKIMGSDKAFLPERIWFVTHQHAPVATASAYTRPAVREDYGMVHFVGVVPAHRGHGLGRTVTIAALQRMVDERLLGAWLSTDDHRIPAIRTYIGLGFEPHLVEEGQRSRWREVLQRIDADLIARFEPQLCAAIHRSDSPSDCTER
jgi:mycothiol synthase